MVQILKKHFSGWLVEGSTNEASGSSGHDIQGGPLPVLNRVITPLIGVISGVITPVTHL